MESASDDQQHHEPAIAVVPINGVGLKSPTHSNAATHHPLETVELANENMAEEATTTKAHHKKNWVKFDDEMNEVMSENYNNNNTGKANNDDDNGSDITTHVDSEIDTVAAGTTTTMTNRLSPPPAAQQRTAAVNAIARPRTPIESTIQPQHSSVQRSTVAANTAPDITPAILATESQHVNLNAPGQPSQLQNSKPKHTTPNVLTTTISNSQHGPLSAHHHNSNNGTPASAMSKTNTNTSIPVESAPGMRTIELSTGRIREGFANGDVIVTLLPANTKWPWITPAVFRPELVPEELMAQGLTLTVEEYVNAMETLVNDYRFTVYNICYKRILVCWIFFAFVVLLTLLFSGLQGVALFALGVGWLFLNAAAIFICMWVKLRLSRGLEKCLARVNKQLMRHKILLVLDDRGRISCHKVNLCFLYFDAAQCVHFLNEFLEQTEQNGGEAIKAGWEAKLDIDLDDIVIQGNTPVRLSRKQAVAQELFLSYLQRWGKDFLRRRLDWTVQEAGVHETPRHLQSSICPCQYEEELLRNKIKLHLTPRQCCGINCIGCWI